LGKSGGVGIWLNKRSASRLIFAIQGGGPTTSNPAVPPAYLGTGAQRRPFDTPSSGNWADERITLISGMKEIIFAHILTSQLYGIFRVHQIS